MKQILVLILVLISVYSCKKDNDEPNSSLSKEKISAKWTVNDTGDFVSFEFTRYGNYIVVKDTILNSIKSKIVLYGTYNIIDNETIVMSDFGTLVNIQINGSSISFSVQPESNPTIEISINADKNAEMPATARTELLCRTWELVTLNGDSVAGTDMELTILFSAAGTYFVSFANPVNENYGGLAQWNWKDETETRLLYSWSETPVWEEASSVGIQELTSNKLVIYDFGDIEIFQPVSNSKSVIIKQ